MTLPLFARKFITDFVETAIALVFGLTLVFPENAAQAEQIAIIVGGALLSALVSALRRAAPGFLVWLQTKLGTEPDA